MGTTAVSAVSRGASGAAQSRRWPLAVIGATEDQRVSEGSIERRTKKAMLRIG
jgi:hypothetical protein